MQRRRSLRHCPAHRWDFEPAALLVSPLVGHRRFGASACHWRKNLPELGRSCRAYAIDLLGYGYSDKVGHSQPGGVTRRRSTERQWWCWWVCVFGAGSSAGCKRASGMQRTPHPTSSMPSKRAHSPAGSKQRWRLTAPLRPGPLLPVQPDPRQQPVSTIYNFNTWSRQLRAFTREVVGGGPVTLSCNSVGGIAGLQVGPRYSGQRRGGATRVNTWQAEAAGCPVKQLQQWSGRRRVAGASRQVAGQLVWPSAGEAAGWAAPGGAVRHGPREQKRDCTSRRSNIVPPGWQGGLEAGRADG